MPDTAPRPPLHLHGWDSGITAVLAPDAPRHNAAHVGWSWRCPRCRADTLQVAPAGALTCPGCEERYPCPPDRAGEPRWPAERSLPRWEDDARLHATGAESWDRYSRSGALGALWGTSTRREPCPEPRPEDEERYDRRVLAAAERGEADDALDAWAQAVTDHVAGLTDAKLAMERMGPLLAEALTATKTKPRKKPGEIDALAVLLDHTAEVAAPKPAPPRRRAPAASSTLTDEDRAGPLPDWYVAASKPCHTAFLGLYGELYIMITDALKARGIEVHGSLDRVGMRLAHDEPFGSYKHALAAALGDGGQIGGKSRAHGGAVPKHPLPKGPVFATEHGAQMACSPSRSSGLGVAGEDEVIAHLDATRATTTARIRPQIHEDAEEREQRIEREQAAEDERLRRARLFALEFPPEQRERIFRAFLAVLRAEAGAHGRELDALDWELLRLVDRGRENGAAARDKRGRVTTEAVEPLTVAEAIADMRVRKIPGASSLTEKQAKSRLRAARRAVQEALRATGQIPPARTKRRAPTGEKRPPSNAPFAPESP